MLNLATLGSEIARRRQTSGFTQGELAARARVSRATVAALENGATRELGFNKVMAILAALKADLALTTLNEGRPTLEDLQREAER
jgi:transcriptional regulator with XRE-family HTH domain